MRQQNHDPHEHRREGRQGGDHLERVLKEHVHNHADCHNQHHDEGGHPGRTVLRNLRKGSRRQVLLRQAVHHAAGTVHVRVQRRDGGGNDDHVQNRSGSRNAQALKDLHERRVRLRHRVPGVQGHDDRQGQNVEDKDAERHRANRLGNRGARVLRLTGGNTDVLDTTEGKHHHGKAGEEAGKSVREEAAFKSPEVRDGGCHRVVRLHTHEEQGDTANNHGDNGADLHEREPEFGLTKRLDLRQVNSEQNQQNRDDPNPGGAVREPELHVHGKGGDVRDGDQRHFQGVGPAGHKTRPASKVAGRVFGERSGNRVRQGEFTHCAHHHEHCSATNNVGKQHGGARQLNGGCRAVEQAGADGGAEGDEHDVTQGESTR